MTIFRFVSIFLASLLIAGFALSEASTVLAQAPVEEADVDQEELLQILNDNSESVVLVYSLNALAPKDQKIYNLAMSPRETKQQIRVGVSNGIVLSEDGYVVVPSDCLKNSSEIIVSVNSEFRSYSASDDLKLTENDYKAKIIKNFPKRNIAILKIKPKNKLKFLKLGFNSGLINSANSFTNKFFGVIGKAKADKFMTLGSPLTTKNNFDKFFSYINAMQYKKHHGAPILIARGVQASNAFLAETNGGAILDRNQNLVGMVLCNYFDSTFPIECGIPAEEIKECVRLAGINLPYMSQNFDNIGIEVSDISQPVKDLGIGKSELEILKIEKNEKDILGVKVESVLKGSKAEASSILPGDIIVLFENEAVLDSKTFRNLEARISGKTTLKVIRNKKLFEIEI